MKHPKTMLIIALTITVLLIGGVLLLNHPSFGRLPQGERMERIRQSPNFRDGKFCNIHPTQQMTSDKNPLSAAWDFLFKKHERLKPEHELPAKKLDLHRLNRKDDLYIWFGHSSYFLQLDGKRFLIDPVFSNRFPMSLMFTPFKGTDLFTPGDMPEIDYLIITHDHWDHLDYYTVKQLRQKVGHVICGLGVGEHFEYWGYSKEQLIEMDWNEQASLDAGLSVFCLPARHFSGRGLSPNRTLWASYMIQTPHKHIYIGGDSGYDDHYRQIARQFPSIDLAIMENGQYDKDWKYIHLLPADLEQAIQDLHPKKLITVHNSKYALSKHAWDEPLKNVSAMARRDSFHLLTPSIGETAFIDREGQQFGEWWKK